MDIAYIKQICFAVLFGVVIFIGYNESNNSVTNYKRGILAAAAVLVCQGVIDQYKGLFVRKFPRFWRAVARYTLIYLVILVFFLYQKAEDARGLLKHLYPELGVPVIKGMHTYDDNCDLEWDNFKDNLDHYYLMHLVGWFVAALMVRDTYILHFWSILDEILELSWQHILPHFRECWWDHVLVDVLLSNTPAIFLGMLVVKHSGLREYDWLGRKGKNSIAEWDIFRNHRRLGCLIALVCILMSNFLSGFFLINSLWIPPKNFINVYRLTVWFLLGSIAIGELYDDVSTWGTPERLKNPISGEHRFICIGVATLEGVISYKFRHDTGNIQDEPTPWYIWLPWLVVTTTIAGFYVYLRLHPQRTTKGGDSPWEIEERRKKSTRLAEKEKKQKAKPEPAEPVQTNEAQNGNAKNKATKEQESQKKQSTGNKVEAASVKTAETVGKKNKKEAEVDLGEWKAIGKGGKQQHKQQKEEEPEEEEEGQEEEPVRVEERRAPVEDEWKEIKSTRAIKKDKKKKRE